MSTLRVTIIALLLTNILQAQVPVRASLQGSVVNWTGGGAIAQAEVELRKADDASAAPVATVTLSDGTFRFSSIPSGRYRIIATKPGYTQSEYGQRKPGGAGKAITISASQLPSITLSMAQTGTISGRIIDRSGQPFQRADVQALTVSYVEGRATLKPVQSAITNDLGEYRLFWMPPGQYYIGARPLTSPTFGASLLVNRDAIDPRVNTFVVNSSRPVARVAGPVGLAANETYAASYFPGTQDLQAAALLNLRAGEEIRDVDLRIDGTPSFRVRVNVIDQVTGQAAAANTTVLLMKVNAPSPGRSLQLTGGTAVFDAVIPGKYELRAIVPRSDQPPATGSAGIGLLMIDLRDRDLDATVSLSSVFVSGRVASEGQNIDLRNVQVVLRSEADYQIVSKVQADGQFSFPGVPRGDYQVSVSPPALQETFVKTIRFGQLDPLNRFIDVDAANRETLEIVLSGNGGAIGGRVVDEKKQTVPNARVVLVPVATSAFRLDRYKAAVADEMGQFELRGIAPGEYTVYSWDEVEGEAWLDPNFMRVFRDYGESVQIRAGQNPLLNLRVIR